MMNFKYTKEQVNVFNFIKKRPENLLIQAYAGCGKTSTVVESLKFIPEGKNVMFMAFNKHIQEELKTRIPEHVRCYTSHGLGMSAIKRKYGDSIKFDEFKLDKHIQKLSKKWELELDFSTHEGIYRYLNNIKKLVNLCRLSLTLDKKFIPFIAERHDISINEKKDIPRILKVLDKITLDRKSFDYTDMIYLPSVDNSIWLFPQDFIYVDEVQDLNRCQIKLIEKSLKRDKVTKKILGRLIVIGDKFQNIYGFNASDERTFKYFEKLKNTKTLPLSTSFRCAKKIIEHAQEIVPDIKALEDAPEGVVRNGNVIEEAQSGDFILCRTTMPLVKLFFEFLNQKKKAIIKGSDIGLQLIELIDDIKTIPQLINYWESEIQKFKSDLIRCGILNVNEHSGFVALEDKVNTLIFLAKISETIPDLKNNIHAIFTDKITGIVLSTVHKSKGLEANRVFIVRPDLLPLPTARGWQYGQEMNLKYVAITRAKTELIYDKIWNDENN